MRRVRTSALLLSSSLLAGAGCGEDRAGGSTPAPSRPHVSSADAGAGDGAVDAGSHDTGVLDAGLLRLHDTGAPDATPPSADAAHDAGAGYQVCSSTFGGSGSCGGDPSGTWLFITECGRESPLGIFRQLCPSAQISERHQPGGALTVHSGGTFTMRISDRLTADVTLPSRCLNTTCSQLSDSLRQVLPDTTVLCNQIGFDCECDVTKDRRVEVSGTWSASGAELTLRPAGAQDKTYWFCAVDGVLQIRAQSPADSFDHSLFRLRQ